MNPKIKKIIAREGLIILGIILIGILIISTSWVYLPYYKRPPTDLLADKPTKDYYAEEIAGKKPSLDEIFKPTPEEAITELNRRVDARRSDASLIGFLFILFGYPIYLLIRFIIWSIKTLKGK